MTPPPPSSSPLPRPEGQDKEPSPLAGSVRAAEAIANGFYAVMCGERGIQSFDEMVGLIDQHSGLRACVEALERSLDWMNMPWHDYKAKYPDANSLEASRIRDMHATALALATQPQPLPVESQAGAAGNASYPPNGGERESAPEGRGEEEEDDGKDHVYCHECSLAGGADMPIYHAPPACKPWPKGDSNSSGRKAGAG